jgi:elongation factor G
VAVHKGLYGSVMAGINKRNGSMTNTESRGDMVCMTAEVPLREMFGYAIEMRGLTSGEGEFSMEYKQHMEMPPALAAAAMEKYRLKRRE